MRTAGIWRPKKQEKNLTPLLQQLSATPSLLTLDPNHPEAGSLHELASFE